MLLLRACAPLVALSLLLSACAGSRLEPVIAPSSDEVGYAVAYPASLDAARERFVEDQKRAQELSSGLAVRASELKAGGDRALLLRVVEESERAGRSRQLERALTEERAVRQFWNDERGPLSSRVAAASQKQASEAGCTSFDEKAAQSSVAPALREGFDRQLERRVRASNEAQRTLELQRARLATGSYASAQKLADEVALASHLVHVALPRDLKEIDALAREQSRVGKTLERALDEERAIQAKPKTPAEQRASQERVVEIEKSRSQVKAAVDAANETLREYEKKLDAAQKEYGDALQKVRSELAKAPPPDKKGATPLPP